MSKKKVFQGRSTPLFFIPFAEAKHQPAKKWKTYAYSTRHLASNRAEGHCH